jgi:tetratricopeptide (TPR) repeat protein
MQRASGRRSRPAVRATLLQTGVIALYFLAVFAGPAAAADAPAANKPAVLSKAQRTKLVTERDRLWQEANRLRDEGKLGDAIPAARQALAIERRLFGSANADVAQSLEWLAQSHLQRDEFDAARTALQESSAIRTKLYGEKDWRAVDARQALRDVEIRSRLTVEERRELITAEQANSQVFALYRKGEFRQAIGLAKQALSIRRRLLGDQHADTALSLNNLAELCRSLGDYAKAEPLNRQALEIYKKVLGENHPSTALSLNNLGCLYELLGDYAKAEPLFRQALEIRSKVLGHQHPDTALSLNSLAELYRSLGDYAKAEPLFRQALEIRSKVLGHQHPDTALSLNSLAELYRSLADYKKAEPLYRQALEIYKKVLGENHPSTAMSLDNLAALYRSLGDYTKSEPLCRQALEIRKKVLGENHPDTATSLNNLALLYKSLGDYAKAEPLYRQALEIRKKVLGENHPSTAMSLDNLAELYRSMGDYAKAEPLYRQALEINKKVLGENHQGYSSSLNNLATFYRSQGDYTKAEPLCRQALEIRKKVLGENHPDTATSLSSLAALYYSMGDYAKAEPLFQQALEIYKKVLGENHPDTTKSLVNLAALYYSMGDYVKAEPLYRQALEISLGGLSHNFGILSERQQLALESDSQWYLDCYLSLASSARIGDGTVYAYVLESKGAVTARQSLVRLERRRPDLKHLFDELQTVGTRLANLSLASADPTHPEVRLQKIEALTEQKEMLEGKLAAQYREFAQTRDAARLGREEQLRKLQAAIPPQTALVDVLEYWHSPPPAAKKGPFEFERRLVSFVVRHDAEVRRVDLGPVTPVAKAINDWRQTYGRPGASNPGSDLRARVWKPLEPALAGAETILFSPDGPLCQFPLAALPGSKPHSYLIEERNIVVIPVPRLVPQLLASAGIQSADGPASAPLLIGDVDFGSEPGIVSLAQSDAGLAVDHSRSAVRGDPNFIFSPLPGTAQEIEEIRTLYRQQFAGHEPQLVSGSKATEEILRTEASRHRWIHVATHGFFAPESVPSALDRETGDKQPSGARLSEKANNVRGNQPGLLSGIALAGANRRAGSHTSPALGANQEPDDGILTALEVEGLDLANVDLVVLSACETGLGKSAGGEGVLGLQRAFQLAGAKTCVTSLWKVDDTATQVLMQEFYGNLWGIDPATNKPRKKLGKLEALKQAQLTMLRGYDPAQKKLRGLDIPAETANVHERGSPFYWAAFVLSGDWR